MKEEEFLMKAAILTPDERFRNFFRRTVREYQSRKCVSFETVAPEVLKDFLPACSEFDILFIDDNFEHRSSLETARLIRTRAPDCAMVLFSSSSEKVFESFALRVHRFFLKPVTQTMIFDALDSFRKESVAGRLVVVRIDGVYHSFPSSDILYLEADGKNCILHTRTGDFLLGTPFSEVQQQLPPLQFFQIHRSYVVNMGRISRFSTEQIFLSGGTELPLSRRRKIEFLISYNKYVRSFPIT